jgi:hypothetical protein
MKNGSAVKGAGRISLKRACAWPVAAPQNGATNKRESMREEPKEQIRLQDLNVGPLAHMPWEQLTPAQRKERMDDMHWMLEMLTCARILGGLEHLTWDVVGKMTFPQYVEAVLAKKAS